MDKLRALEVFVSVAKSNSFAGAARALSMSPPSVTRVIGELETSLGVVLFHRTTRRVTLTQAGEIYRIETNRILRDVQLADDAARGHHSIPQGHLRVTAPSVFGQMHVAPLLTAYLNAYEGVSAEGVFVDRVVNMLDEGIDVAVRIGELKDSSFIARRAGNVQSMICASPQYIEKCGVPESPEALLAHQLVGQKLPHSRIEWRFASGLLRVNPRLTVNSVNAALTSVLSGWGIGRFFSYQVEPYISKGQLIPLLSSFAPPCLPVNIIYGEGRLASAKVRTFVELALSLLKENISMPAAD